MHARRIAIPLVAIALSAGLFVPVASANQATAQRDGSFWNVPTSLPEPRSRPAVALGHDGHFYVFGGFTGSVGSATVTNSTFVFNPRTGIWSQGTTMPVAMEGGEAVTMPDGRIAVMGGGTGCFNTEACTIYQTVQVYNPKTHAWCMFAPMLSPRYLFGAVLGHDGRVYAIGGWNGTNTLASVEALDIRHDVWEPVASLPQPEEAIGAIVTHNRIVVIGGSDALTTGFTTVYNDVFVYNGRRWNAGSPMPTPRSDFAIATNRKGQIYVIGGYSPGLGYLSTVEVYNPPTDSWSPATSMPSPLSSLRAATGKSGQIYAFGGYNGNPVAQVLEYGSCGCHSNPFTS